MERRNTIIFFCVFFALMYSGAMFHQYVEQHRIEKFYQEPSLLSLSHHEEIEREVFDSREYVKIKSLAN
ncbi:hypothetical protein ACFPTR_13035 [Aliibacillus thermotolerans]|uniref:Uncharacterized protein n=1 Tax=Aliibacillus thermotolerans TaxID=1834418 RepID=A0ABW0U8H0_9BACI|nr:hypothetical protein [Aliibacillus thermotolerans]MDA3130777.1 hypothetical protein [Aliibacillus thermotolerans]